MSGSDIKARIAQAAAYRQAGRLAEAERAYRSLLSIEPNLPDCWYNLGLVQRRLGRYEEALRSYQQSLDRGASQPEEIRLNRAVILADYLRDEAAAEAELQAALQLNPGYVAALINLGNLYEDRGDRTRARGCYERALTLAPDHPIALARLANLTTIEDASNVLVGRLETALGQASLANAERAELAFALGRALDEGGAYERAFKAYATANALSRTAAPAAPRYDRAAQEAFVEQIITAYADRSASAPTSSEPAPIFICGMFRSGSTLAEQILAGHSRVTPGGELDFLPRLVREKFAPFPERAVNATEAEMAHIARDYRSMLARVLPEHELVTDKRPDNFFYIGLIKRLFPSARIVHTIRHPLDNVLSIYFLNLDHSMAYALDLMDAAHYYRQYRRLMAHWKRLYGADIFEFDYDAFVRAPERHARDLLGFLGLEWQDACLSFHERTNPVKTASVWQVRRPLYRHASGRWRHYAQELAGVAHELRDLVPPA
jgi:tetratricopeptide (TPR) repeat protein